MDAFTEARNLLEFGGKVALPLTGLFATGWYVRIAEISSGVQSASSLIPSLNFAFEDLLLNALILLKLSSNYVFLLLYSDTFLTSLLYLATRF